MSKHNRRHLSQKNVNRIARATAQQMQKGEQRQATDNILGKVFNLAIFGAFIQILTSAKNIKELKSSVRTIFSALFQGTNVNVDGLVDMFPSTMPGTDYLSQKAFKAQIRLTLANVVDAVKADPALRVLGKPGHSFTVKLGTIIITAVAYGNDNKVPAIIQIPALQAMYGAQLKIWAGACGALNHLTAGNAAKTLDKTNAAKDVYGTLVNANKIVASLAGGLPRPMAFPTTVDAFITLGTQPFGVRRRAIDLLVDYAKESGNVTCTPTDMASIFAKLGVKLLSFTDMGVGFPQANVRGNGSTARPV